MYSALLLTVALASAVAWETVPSPEQYVESPDFYQYLHAPSHHRQTRQLHGSTFFNSDKTSGFNARLPFASTNNNVFSAIGGANFDANRHLSSATYGLALDNKAGHGLSLTNTRIPNFGNRITAAGHANLFHNQNHDLTANAFLSRNMPTIPQVPNFNTVGGGVDYMFKNKVGGSLGVAHTPFLQRTDYSANGIVNLFRNKDTSLDFNAGLSKSVSPFMSNSKWEPSTGFTLRKFF